MSFISLFFNLLYIIKVRANTEINVDIVRKDIKFLSRIRDESDKKIIAIKKKTAKITTVNSVAATINIIEFTILFILFSLYLK